MGKEKKRRREEEIVEAALAAAGAALAISAMKKLFSLVLHRWPISLISTPPHFLFVMLNLVIASILVFSLQVQPRKNIDRSRKKRRRDGSFANSLDVKKVKEKEEKEEEVEGDVEELNRRAEAFIMAFRHQLRVDSFSSGVHQKLI
ncbi:hypothetical protein LUZ61_019950 [Rhynchospora tenuis]|uniref:DUF4408 domain-containing protein n=1 Tax=Rhynchospora tenuis TaxID=198213 RepID=A0AAD5ZCB8_9POAL|nr:hypothetical protein LUZ61_019950 [Rhynchospora tenuis]